MKWYYNECRELVGKTILVNDQGVLVERKVVKAYGQKAGRDSWWGVDLDKPICDDVTGVAYRFVKAVLSDEDFVYRSNEVLKRKGDEFLKRKELADKIIKASEDFGKLLSEAESKGVKVTCESPPYDNSLSLMLKYVVVNYGKL